MKTRVSTVRLASFSSIFIVPPRNMSFTVEIKKEFEQRSERVKSVDLHPTEPWVLLGLHSGTISILNYHTQATEKSFEITKSPVRTAKFISRKQWIVTGADDGFIRVYNYNTMEKVVEFKAHTDYIRSVIVHPTFPYVVSASDDKLIKLWDWENDWTCTQTFEGHDNYVMQVAFNPKDANIFASASLDCTIKTWDLGSSSPRLSIEGHSKGLNCVEFFETGDKLYMITGSDDYTAKVWDYEVGTCVQILEGHTHNVTSILRVHSEVDFIMTGSEDGSVRVWNTKTYNLDNVFTSELGRVWTIGFIKDSPKIILGCDEGTIVVEYITTHV